jgi:hypothetical protein
MVLGPDAYANALALPSFYGALYSGTTSLVDEARIGRKFGFDWAEDQQIPTDLNGTITTGLSLVAATTQPVGTTAVLATTAASTGACNLNAGCLIKFAGDSQVYSLTSSAVQASASGAVTLNISPSLQVAQTGGAAVTLVNSQSGLVNLAFHPWSMAFASRPLMNDEIGQPIDMEYTDTDPVSGVTMRLSVRQEFRRTRFSYDVLWGVGPVRPALACRVYG